MRKVQAIAACFRLNGPNEASVAKAARQLREHPEDAVRAQFEWQLALDAEIARTLAAATVPPSVVAASEAAGTRPAATWLQHLRQPPIAAAVISVFVILGLLGYLWWDQQQDFPGKGEAIRMIEVADEMTGLEMEPVEIDPANLGDWLFMKRRLEHYDAPPEFHGLNIVLARQLALDGKPVAQVALERPQSLLYIFRTADFARTAEASETWRPFHDGGWAGAVRRQGDLCYVITLKGKDEALAAFLDSRR